MVESGAAGGEDPSRGMASGPAHEEPNPSPSEALFEGSGTRHPLRSLLLDAVVIAALHAMGSVVVRGAGFDHVSDDDFARVTIAQTFAHAPKLDPSGTSWLPFPFWLLGGSMMVFGRSLATSRVLSIVFASLAATTPYLALRFTRAARAPALLSTALAFATPWAFWLGATTVPESFTASLTAAAVIGLAQLSSVPASDGARGITSRFESRVSWAFAGALALASLSRYEPWPVAAVLATSFAHHATRRGVESPRRRVCASISLICALGPILWMAWNAYAHDGPLHFFHRVSSFKRAIGDGAVDPLSALLLYPKLLVTTRPEIAIGALLLLPTAIRNPEARSRWGLPLLCAAAQLVFLSYGNARDGAPAHHPERALLGTVVILALFVGEMAFAVVQPSLVDQRPCGPQRLVLFRSTKIVGACMGILWLVALGRASVADLPAQTPSEDRTEQLARGLRLRGQGVTRLVVTPCAFEHFALLAAFAAPENAEVMPRTNAPVTAACPRVDGDHDVE